MHSPDSSASAATPDSFARVSFARTVLRLAIPAVLLAAFVALLSRPLGASGALPPLELFLDPWHGALGTARLSNEVKSLELRIGALSAPVKLYRDERGVPHIFAQNDFDAVAALGYVTARDRLFRMDFQARVAAGRLAEVFGSDFVARDKYLRRTGMLYGAERSWELIQRSSPVMKQVLERYADGVNAYIATLDDRTKPFEFRLRSYSPEPWTPVKTLLTNQLMAFDLCFLGQVQDVANADLMRVLGAEAFAQLYPDHAPISEPYSPEPKGVLGTATAKLDAQASAGAISRAYRENNAHNNQARPQTRSQTHPQEFPREAMAAVLQGASALGQIYSGLDEGKGSNNWVVAGSKTASGKPLLAGDPHLDLALPSVWYEAHLVTPSMNTYGVTIPGAPLIIVGFNNDVAWTPTNTGADVLDFYSVVFDDAAQRRYKHNGAWKPVREDIRPIRVAGKPDVADTVRYTHWGPVITQNQQTLAIRWTAHNPSTIIEALWGMNHAKNWTEFSAAQRKWDVPAQNIAYADRAGNIALRSCGVYPIRRKGHGRFIHDGATDEGEWIGVIPFDSIPASLNPSRAWLSSANQDPVPRDYPYYLGYDWTPAWRGMRIREMLEGSAQSRAPISPTSLTIPTIPTIPATPKTATSLAVSDFQAMQLDVQSQQFRQLRDIMAVCGAAQSISDPTKKQAVERLLAWDGVASKDSRETLLFKLFWDEFTTLVWDEIPDSLAGEPNRQIPQQDVLTELVRREPTSAWFDRRSTPLRETAQDICKQALKSAADSLVAKYGADPSGWTWSKHHSVIIRHLLRVGTLKPLWRGPYPFQGFSSTVLPAGGMEATHSASWRMIVDAGGVTDSSYSLSSPSSPSSSNPSSSSNSSSPPDRSATILQGYAVFPGGVSGNPFSPRYDSQIQHWLDGRLYKLYKPVSAESFVAARLAQAITLKPLR
jgi:penicillin G amidase